MIRNIRHKGLAALFYEDQTRGVLQAHVKPAVVLEDMNAPGLRLHALKGDRAGFYAVVVSGNWRVIFRFSEAEGDAFDVDYLDYH